MIPDMSLVPKREYVVLLAGDVAVFVVSLWTTLGVRYLGPPSSELFMLHAVPFAILFAVWGFIFFLAGLYGRHTRLFFAAVLQRRYSTRSSSTWSSRRSFSFSFPLLGLRPRRSCSSTSSSR